VFFLKSTPFPKFPRNPPCLGGGGFSFVGYNQGGLFEINMKSLPIMQCLSVLVKWILF